MNKTQLIFKISADAGISKARACIVLDVLTKTIMRSLKSRKKINLIGLGIFSVFSQRARIGRNPLTGNPIQIKSKKKVRFKMGFELSDALNNSLVYPFRVEQNTPPKKQYVK